MKGFKQWTSIQDIQVGGLGWVYHMDVWVLTLALQTVDFFDGKHNIVLGGSWATHPRLAGRKSL